MHYMENKNEIIKETMRMMEDTKAEMNRMTKYHNRLESFLKFEEKIREEHEGHCIIKIENMPEEELMKILAPLICSKKVTINGHKDIKGKLKGIYPGLQINLHKKEGNMLFLSLYNLFSKYNEDIKYWLSRLEKL